MENQLLNVSHRMPDTKANQLRRQGYIPGVIYGCENNTIPVIFDKKDVENFIRYMGSNAMFQVSISGESKPVYIKQVQRDPVTREIIHIDLQNVYLDRKIRTKVPLKFEGVNEIERRGMVLQRQKQMIEVEGMAKDIPGHITVPVSLANVNQNIKIMNLEVSKEISIIDSLDEIVASVIRPNNEAVAESTQEAEEVNETTEAESKAE